jgi:hypothetical protein
MKQACYRSHITNYSSFREGRTEPEKPAAKCSDTKTRTGKRQRPSPDSQLIQLFTSPEGYLRSKTEHFLQKMFGANADRCENNS